MTVYSKREHCCGCAVCANICPQNAIRMEIDSEGFRYPVIDKDKCSQCGLCQMICGFKPVEEKRNPKVFAIKHNDEAIRMNSSSGGAFSRIANEIINQGGTVYGAAFDEYYDVSHQRATTLQECILFRRSKYVQSLCDNVYNQVKNDLSDDRYVLYSGTPCQITALYSYLGKPYDKLITVDIACHGTPSPLIWKEYKKYLENKYQDTIQQVNFRNKKKGWRLYSLEINFEKHTYISDLYNDPYSYLFLNNYTLRPCCHECPYTSFSRTSDITLADFWGIEAHHRNFDDNKGISLVLLNSPKGVSLFEQISNDFLCIPSDTKECLQGVFISPSTPANNRQLFWDDYLSNGFEHAMQKFVKRSIVHKFKAYWLIPLLRKLGMYEIAFNFFRIFTKRKGEK